MRLQKNQLWELRVEFTNGKVYGFEGETKKECTEQYRDMFGTFKPSPSKTKLIKTSWNILDSGSFDVVEENV